MGRSWAAAALAAVAAWIGACSCEDRVAPVDGLLVVEPASIDFGRVALGTTARRTLRLRNAGRAPLTLQALSIEGLGKDLWIERPAGDVLAPGAELTLALRFVPTVEQTVERVLELRVDDRRRPRVEVPTAALALRPRVTPSPELLDFGRVELAQEERRTVTLRNEFELPLEVALQPTGDPQLDALAGPSLTLGPLQSVELEARFRPIRVGRAEASLRLRPCPSCAWTSIELRGEGVDRALVVEPAEVDFGSVAVDRQAEREVTLRNVASRPLEVLSLTIDPGHPAFDVEPLRVVLAEGESVRTRVRFGPTRLGPDRATARVRSSSRRVPETAIPLSGVGGGPEIAVVPHAVELAPVPAGGRYRIELTVTNVGVDPTQPPLAITAAEVRGAPEFRAELPGAPWLLAAGEARVLSVWYEPFGLGLHEAVVAIRSNDGASPEVLVPVRGSTYPAPPCQVTVTPEALDFAALDPGRGAVLGVQLRNPGDTVCVLRELSLAPGSDPVFTLPGGPMPTFLLRPGEWFGRMVGYDPHAIDAGSGAYRGELWLSVVEGAALRQVRVPLRAMGALGCLRAVPRFLDFGAMRMDCGAHVGAVELQNHCAGALRVDSIELGAQSAPGEFEIADAPATPFLLPGRGVFPVNVRWWARTRGASFAPLYVTESARPRPLLVPLLGDLLADGGTVDRFTRHAPGAVDLLLVIDNSSSMREEQQRIARAVGALLVEAEARGIDYRIAVTTTGLDAVTTAPACPGGALGGEAGRFFPVDGSRPRVLTPATPDVGAALAANTQVGLCHHLEQGMEAMRLALSAPLSAGLDDPRTPLPSDGNGGFLRAEAELAVIFVGEEDDHSGWPVEDYVRFLQRLKGEGGAVVSAIVDVDERCAGTSGVATRYLELVRRTGGVASSICEADWEAILRQAADRAFAPRDELPLSATPDAGGVRVFVDGVEVAPSGFSLDGAGRALRFQPWAEPAPGARIEVRYRAVCP